MLSRRSMCGALLLVAAAVIAIPHAGVSAATVTPPKPLLGAKLAGKVGMGTAIIALNLEGKKGLRVEVGGLKALAGKTVGVGFTRGTKNTAVGTIKLNADGNGVLMTPTFPEAREGDICKVLGEQKVVVLEGAFKAPPK
ncbi:MAG: hypothetical protein NTZ32_26295 [Planctomycetales bacterium]|nr:hypothetical protein [Planctomycetales bacterium]